LGVLEPFQKGLSRVRRAQVLITDDATTYAAGATRVLAAKLGWDPETSDPGDPTRRSGTRVDSRAAVELAHDPQGFSLLVRSSGSLLPFFIFYTLLFSSLLSLVLSYSLSFLFSFSLFLFLSLVPFAFSPSVALFARFSRFLALRSCPRRATTPWTWPSTRPPRSASTLN
jgi:hypothetical protein